MTSNIHASVTSILLATYKKGKNWTSFKAPNKIFCKRKTKLYIMETTYYPIEASLPIGIT